MCNACAVAEAVRLRPMVCIGDVAPVWMISTFALWALWRGRILRVAGPGGIGDVSSMVEQSPVKRKDIGSSPVRPARSEPGEIEVQSCLLAGCLPSRQAVADTDTISPCVPEHMATAP